MSPNNWWCAVSRYLGTDTNTGKYSLNTEHPRCQVTFYWEIASISDQQFCEQNIMKLMNYVLYKILLTLSLKQLFEQFQIGDANLQRWGVMFHSEYFPLILQTQKEDCVGCVWGPCWCAWCWAWSCAASVTWYQGVTFPTTADTHCPMTWVYNIIGQF